MDHGRQAVLARSTGRISLCSRRRRAPSRPVRRCEIGFEHEGTYPRGISKKGGGHAGVHPPLGRGLDELSAAASCRCWATSRRPASTTRIATTPRSTATTSTRDRPTRSLGARTPFTTKITITGPADFTLNSVGTKTADTVEGRPPHRRLGERPPGELLQRHRGPMAGRARARARPCIITPAILTTSPRCARRSTPPAAITPSGSTPTPGAS